MFSIIFIYILQFFLNSYSSKKTIKIGFKMQKRRVVVTGIGVLSPLGASLKESWQNLVGGQSGITKLGPEFDGLPCKIGGYVKENGQKFQLSDHFTKTQMKSMAPATGFALLAAGEALKDAQVDLEDENLKLSTGVAVGMGMVDLQDICDTYEALKRGYKHVSPFFIPRILPNLAGGQISIKYGFRGPNHAVSTACASGAHAIGDSFRFIQNNYADMMICGGTESPISPLSIASFCRLRALSTNFNEEPSKASRPFDKLREGFVMGEGSAILVLEELNSALKRPNVRIYGEILGYGLSGDASHLTAPSPDGLGAFLAMNRALNDAQITPNEVTYINAHATSTPMGDSIEIKAINKLFPNNRVAVSSTKGAHGHLLGAAGNLEAALTLKAIFEGALPPTINLEQSDFENVNFVAEKGQKWDAKRRVALKNAFGFGGTNASLCFGQYEPL